ncbi:MAG: hypothetical protein ACREDV_02605, partial [Methylocella sp.]
MNFGRLEVLDVSIVIGGLKETGFFAQLGSPASSAAPNPLANGEAIEPDPDVDCRTFQFGAQRVRIHSNLAGIGGDAFLDKRRCMRPDKKICLPPNWGMRA